MTIEKYLLEKGFKANLKGFYYLVEAIRICKEDKTLLRAIMSRLYPTLSKTFNDTDLRVERAIRYSLIKAKRPETNSQFIAKAVIELEN